MRPRVLWSTTLRQQTTPLFYSSLLVRYAPIHLYKRGMENDTMPDVKSLDDAPASGQRVEWQGKAYTTVQEGRAFILVPETETEAKKGDNKDSTAANAGAGPVRTVFYNPIQQFNRDLTVLAIEAYGEEVVHMRKKAREVKNMKNANKRKRLATKTTSTEEAQDTLVGDAEVEDPEAPQDSTVDAGAPVEVDNNSSSKRKREEYDGDEAPNKIAKPDDATSPHEAAEEAGGIKAEDKEKHASEHREGKDDQKKQKGFVPRFTILDALSASGLRALRYASEIPFVTKVTANDLDPAATEAIARNIQHNKLQPKIDISQGNAIGHMYTKIAASMSLSDKEMAQGKADKYDVIDLDPYGTAANFLDAAVQAVHDSGGLLCVTCTDAGVWASNSYPEKAFALYGGAPIKGWHSHEVGLRLILNAINTAAARYGLYMEPLLSLSIDFYARVFVKIKKSPAAVKFAAGKTMIVYNCDAGCGAWTTQLLLRNRSLPNKKGQGSFYKHQFTQGPTANSHCEHCGFKTHLAGPMYAGRLHDPEYIKKILNKLPDVDNAVYGTTDRIKGMLTTALEEHLDGPPTTNLASREDKWAEIEPYPFFFTPTQLSKVVHCATPGENAIRGALRGLGYRVTRSHCKPGSIKTDAPWAVLWHVVREWVRQKSPIKESSILPGSAGYKILNMHKQADGAAKGDGTKTVTHAARPSGVQTDDLAEAEPDGLKEKVEVERVAEDPSASEKDAGGDTVNGTEREAMPEVVFDEQLGKEIKPGGERKLVRYQMNPRENWGPMNRARGS